MWTGRIKNGDTEKIVAIMVDASGNTLTGLSNVFLKIRRLSDDKYIDFDDNTFKSSGWGSVTKVMTEVDSTNSPGEYGYSFSTSGFSDDIYILTATSASAANSPQKGELKVGDYVDDIGRPDRKEHYAGLVRSGEIIP